MTDKHGREIRVGDLLKVFHFIGPRRRKCYLYKVVFAGDDGTLRLRDVPQLDHVVPLSVLRHQECRVEIIADSGSSECFWERNRPA